MSYNRGEEPLQYGLSIWLQSKCLSSRAQCLLVPNCNSTCAGGCLWCTTVLLCATMRGVVLLLQRCM
jgi:hypothetical protein